MRATLSKLREMKARREPISMLTAYDYPTACAAQAAGIHSLLIGDSANCVVLGRQNTRDVPLEFLLMVGEAVRHGAPDVFLIGDLPFESVNGGEKRAAEAAQAFRQRCGVDAVKLETASGDDGLVRAIRAAGIDPIAHLGLKPQSVLAPEHYKAQARDQEAIELLVNDAVRMVQAGAAMLLLEAVPDEAARAVLAAVSVPIIGCGAGPACDGHVVVTHDMLGLSDTRPPRFVPVLSQMGAAMRQAMSEYARAIAERRYPGPEHAYHMKRAPATSARQ